MSLEEFYDRYHRQALGLAYRIVRRSDLAEQVVLDAYLDVWRSGHADDPAAVATRTRLMATIRRHALARVRGDPRTLAAAVDAMVDATGRVDGPASAAGSDTGARVRRALAGAEPSHVRALELAYARGLPRREIAARLGSPVEAVTRDLRSALDRVRCALGIARIDGVPAEDGGRQAEAGHVEHGAGVAHALVGLWAVVDEATHADQVPGVGLRPLK